MLAIVDKVFHKVKDWLVCQKRFRGHPGEDKKCGYMHFRLCWRQAGHMPHIIKLDIKLKVGIVAGAAWSGVHMPMYARI